MRDIDHIIVHCSATPPHREIGATDIDRWHRAKKWLGNGYHYVIRRGGLIESNEKGQRCRPLHKAGAHVGDCGRGWNRRSIGICLVGGVDAQGKAENNYTPEQMASLRELLDWLLIYHPNVTIMGHRDLIALTGAPPKDCPCFDVEDWYNDY